MAFRCVLHGSFRKHHAEIVRAKRVFEAAGIEVLAPKDEEIAAVVDGFALFESEKGADPRLIELMYLHHLKRLGADGFSYFVDPEGYVGKSASYELGIAQIANVPCFFSAPIADHPAYIHRNAVWSPEDLAAHVVEKGRLPAPAVHPDEAAIHRLWEDLMVPGSVVATGGIIEYDNGRSSDEREILLVKTHKWGNRWSVVGGKVRRNERLLDALVREVKEETGLLGQPGAHLATFDQIKGSGYYQAGTQHVFVDYVVRADSRRVTLNEEAQEHIWIPAKEALASLEIEPNARHIVELYAAHAA
ncbi:MAG TPA: NUDIX domain-containing protein [Candidatus Baltobacteraceae bacterium]|nr:NUDIX domain-containing protein [Candidatus Baltobacteraceae bacterium]